MLFRVKSVNKEVSASKLINHIFNFKVIWNAYCISRIAHPDLPSSIYDICFHKDWLEEVSYEQYQQYEQDIANMQLAKHQFDKPSWAFDISEFMYGEPQNPIHTYQDALLVSKSLSKKDSWIDTIISQNIL